MKIIKGFNLDTKNIKEGGEARALSVSGENGAVFSLEIKSGSNYYNFQTNLFQTAKARLSNVNLGGEIFVRNVIFPSVSAGAQYDIYLIAEGDTKHSNYREVRFPDGSMDINSTTGSNSKLVQKVIYQTLDVTITISGYSPNDLVTGGNTNSTITTSRGKSVAKIPFSYTFTSTATKSLTINKQPVSSDIMAYVEPVIGANPINIPGEDIYPAVTTADKVVNVSGGTAVDDDPPNVTMDDDFTGLWAVGDRITGNTALDARTQETAVTVAAINVGSNAKVFTMSEGIVIADDETLSFSNRRNYRWPISSTTFDVSEIKPGMRQVKSTFFANPPIVKEYLTQITVHEGKKDEYKIDKVRIPAVETLGIKPILVRDSTTKVVTTTIGTSAKPINITFSEQALLTFGGITSKVYSYGESEINRLTGYDVEFSDLAIASTEFTTTTTTVASAATTFNVTSAIGIADDISTVSGIGIDSSVVSPTVTTITNLAGTTYTSGSTGYPAAILTLSAAQTLESGITLTFPGASNIVTITGNIKVNNVGNNNIILRFDLEKLLTMH